MQEKPKKQVYDIKVEFPNSITRTVKVKAISREKAEQRALKFHPNAIGITRDGV